MNSARILIVDDDRDVLESARMFLKQEFTSIDIEEDPRRIPDLLGKNDYDVILLDMNFSKGVNDGDEGFYWLEKIVGLDPQAVVILITAYAEVDLAVQAMKFGAADFVMKPWKNQKLLATVIAAVRIRRSGLEVARLKETQERLANDISDPYSGFVGESPAIQRVHEIIHRVAGTDADVLILGENGTGKELVAREIHRQSHRRSNVFMSVDLGALSESLFESELFGHVKGAFTDARQDKPGRFELAAGGTLFLDEIGNLTLPLQAKLLTVLQHRRVQRLGSAKEIKVDFRLICATNMALNEMVVEKKFRQDLLYRINTVEIRVPPLRERVEDIPLLAGYFLSQYSMKYKRDDMRIEKSVMNRLKKYAWPGNIRELQHAVERAVILTDGKSIDTTDVLIGGPPALPEKKSQSLTMEEMEKQFILQSIQDHDGNISSTAKTLGMTRPALYRRMKKHGIG